MEILGSFIQPLMSYIGAPVIRQFGYLKAKENVKELSSRLAELEPKKQDIQNRIDAAWRHGQEPTEQVRWWFNEVEVLRGEVTEVQSDYDQIECRCWPNYCWSSYKIGRRASELLRRLDSLKNKPDGFGDLVTDAPPTSVEQMSSTSDLVGNMINLNKEKICGYLREETDGVIGIWGMGGVGKTTLLEAINDSFLNNNNGNSGTANKLFDPVISIVVSKEHQLENLQRSIVQRLRLLSSDDLVSQARIISEYLKEKNFLLLLDDIWEVVQLKDLGIPHLHSNSSNNIERRFRRKVVFTTRSLQVCASMKCHKTIKVECLEPSEARDLFNKNVGGDIIDLPDIRSRAEEVTKECGGLPLALVVIGRAMATKRSPEEWDYALTQLRKAQPSNIPGMELEENYFLRLKFSYDSLRNDIMRECFLCCSLWPEDFEIVKTDLVLLWMGLGLIKGFEDIDEAYGEGYTFIGSLITAGLLEPVNDDRAIKMHDVIRDLALWIARDCGKNINKWLVKAGVGLEEVPNELVGAAERISLMENKIKELPSHLPPCPNLSTLILIKNWGIVGIPSGFFTSTSELTYLDLSHTRLQDIPKEICHLKQLRYLDLSSTRISKLPEELAQLRKLKCLLLGWNDKLKVEVRRIIGRLPELEYLDLYGSGAVDGDELQSLPLSLKAVGMEITSEHALRQLPRVVPTILHLAIADIGGDSSSTTSIHLHHLLSSRTKKSLRVLWFTKCHSIRELVVGADVRLPSLEALQLSRLENLTVLVAPSECFERLRKLYISECHGLKDITWVLHLPCLESLYLHDCNEMEQLVVIGGGGEEVTKPTFPRLRELTLRFLPKLAMICDNHAAAAAVNFPSLEILSVWGCEGLKKLPFHPQLPLNNNCSRLKYIYGKRQWWDAIEWEDQSAQSSLLPYFVPFP